MEPGLETLIMLIGGGVSLLVSTAYKRRCKNCHQHWVFRPNGFTETAQDDAREEWECENCGHREWKKRKRLRLSRLLFGNRYESPYE